ncbi:MAG: hypothetical protein HQ580_00910 [Planctomycetes bacterium]|nr:hypothetical protein [Planctomycetota bacterium]
MKKSSTTKLWPKPSLNELAKIHGLDPTKFHWSELKELKDLTDIFHLHRNTMRQWLEEQRICNQQMSSRRWRVLIGEFPDGLG